MTPWLAIVCAVVAAALAPEPRPRLPRVDGVAGVVVDPGRGILVRHRLPAAALAGTGAALLVGGPAGPVLGVGAAVAAWSALGRVEPAHVRIRREAVGRDLPHVVLLLEAALRNGAAPAEAARLVARALPGPAAELLDGVAARLGLGADPGQVWASLAGGPLAPLGRVLARSHHTGASVTTSVGRLGHELAERRRGDVQDRARAVGVKAAVPLGLCLLPAFVLVGIVPLVAGLVDGLAW